MCMVTETTNFSAQPIIAPPLAILISDYVAWNVANKTQNSWKKTRYRFWHYYYKTFSRGLEMKSKSQRKPLLWFIIAPLLAIHYQLLLTNFKREQRQIKHETLRKTGSNILSSLWNYILNVGIQLESKIQKKRLLWFQILLPLHSLLTGFKRKWWQRRL